MLVEKKSTNLNEKRYHFLIDNILDVVGELDLNGIFTYVNPYIYDELGYQPDEIIGREIYDFVHPDDAKKIAKVLFRRPKSHDFIPEIRLKNDKNQFIWYEIKARRLKDYNNQRKILITLKNISKVKVLEEKLEKKDENYQKITNSFPEIQFWKVFTPSKYERAIRTTSEMLKVIIENIPQCVFWKDTNFKYLGCNGNYSEFIGIEHPESIIGKTDEDLLSNREKIQQIRESETSVMLSGKPLYHTNESWIIEKGNDIWLDINRVPLIETKGDVNGILVTFEEITDRKIAEEKLRNSEKKYKNLSIELETIMDIIPSMIVVKNKSDIYTRVNQVFADYLKLEKEDIIGKSTFDLFPQELATNLKRDDLEVIENGIPKLNIEEIIEFPGGKVSGIISKMPYYNEKDEINGVIGFAIDISERKELEQRLIKSEERYRELANSLPQVICETDERGNLTFVNKNAYSVFGYTPDDYNKGLNALQMLIPEDRKRAMENIKRKKRGKKEEKMRDNEYTALRKDGSTFPVIIYSNPIIDKDTSVGMRSIIIDITDQKKAENEIKNLAKFPSENPNPVLRLTKEKVIYTNKEGENLFNTKEGSEVPVVLQESVIKALDTNKVITTEIAINSHIYSLDITPISEEGYANVYGKDISERKKAGQKLKESEEKYKSLFEQFPMAILLINFEGVIEDCNTSTVGLFGYTKEELLGKEYLEFDILPPDTKLMLAQSFSKFLKTRVAEHIEIQMYRKDGKIVWINSYPIVIKIAGSSYVLTVLQDITQRKTSEEKIRYQAKIIENMSEGLYLIKLEDGTIVYTNPAFEKMFGYDPGEMIGENVAIINAPTDKTPEETRNEIIETLKDTGEWHREVLNAKKDGTPFWCYANVSVFDHPDHGSVIISIHTDITERKKTDQILKESQKKYKLLSKELELILDHIVGPVFYKDTKNTLIWVNRYIADAYKMKREDLIGKSLFEFYPKEVAQTYWDDDLEVINSGKPKLNKEESWETADGLKWFLTSKIPYIDEKGDIKGIIGTSVDISERKIAEQKLIESEAKHRGLLETAVMGLIEIDLLLNKISYFNPKLLEIVGYTREELKDDSIFYKLIHPEDLEEVLKSHGDRDVEFRIYSKEGKLKWLSGTRKYTISENGELINVRLWLQDITESKEIEEIKSSLLTRFSHEFKTPLISIKGFADFLLTEYKVNLDEKILSFLRRIKSGSNRLEALINSFIESSQLEKAEIRVNLRQEEVSDLIQEVVHELEGYIGMREHTINVSLDEKLITTIDKEKIYTVLSNILINAIDYTPQGGKISIKSSIDKNFLTISVKDNGIGLTEEEKKCLFKLFGKIERYGKGWDITVGGMGMGLYISKEIIELHGGKIWAESEGRSKGSEFHFSLPIK